MAISTRLAAARLTTLTTCLVAALAAGTADARHAYALPQARNLNARTESHTPFAPFAALAERSTQAAHERVASGSLIPVIKCEDDGTDGTLRKAIESAADGDTIDMSALSCSLITLQSGALQSQVANLTLKGPGIDALTIDGNNADRVIHGTNLDISDLTMAHGIASADIGGGCVFAYGDLSLTRSRLTACVNINNVSDAAGGAAFVVGDLTMHDAAIVSNRATGAAHGVGGGVVVGGSATLYASTISGNKAQASADIAYAGGLFGNGPVTLHASIVDHNEAHSTNGAAYGGGIHASQADVLVLDGSTISANDVDSDTSWSYGGGINSGTIGGSTSAVVTVKGSTITGNTSSSSCPSCLLSGGGINAFDSIDAEYSTISYNDAVCNVTASGCAAGGGGLRSVGSQVDSKIWLHNTTVSGNSAVGGTQAGFALGGGLMAVLGPRVVAHNATIAFNHASQDGGGIALTASASSSSELVSTIVASNTSDAGPNDVGLGPFGNNVTIDGSKDLVMTHGANVTLPANTLTGDPHLQPLALTEGGPTAVHPIPSNSVAIDAGSNPDSAACDQRAYPYHRVHGANADIGAYEFQGEAHLFADNFEVTLICNPVP